MRNRIVLLLVLLLLKFNLLFSQNIDTGCNRTVNFKEYSSLLPEGFCMPEGYWAVDIYEADVNKDEKQDRIIKYYKKNWNCGDTIFLSVYFSKNDSTYKFIKTFSNLYTPLIRESMDIPWILENCVMPDSVARYAWQNSMWLLFENGFIIVPFAVDLWTGYDFYFEYDKVRKNWYLTKQQEWFIPDGEYERKYAPDSKIDKVENGICIDDFRIKDYLRPW